MMICVMIISTSSIFSRCWISTLLERNRCHGNAENRANRCPPPPRHATPRSLLTEPSCRRAVLSDSPRNSHVLLHSGSRISIFHQLSFLFHYYYQSSSDRSSIVIVIFVRNERKRKMIQDRGNRFKAGKDSYIWRIGFRFSFCLFESSFLLRALIEPHPHIHSYLLY